MNRLQSTRLVLWFASVIAAAGATGCSVPKASDFKPSKLFSLGDDDEPRKGKPVRMVGTWTDTVLSQPGQKSQRGFGGRILFYGAKEEKPILVDGQLVVYAFDEAGRKVTDNRPTRRYVFPADQMPLHMSKSELGASYSFWLPWDDAGGPQTEVSLICRFEPKGGAVITSEQTRHRLPGSIPPDSPLLAGMAPKLPEGVPSRPAQATLESLQASRAADQGTQLASYESTAPSESEPARRMTTTSIALPKNFQVPDVTPPRPLQQPHQATPLPANPPPASPLPTSPSSVQLPSGTVTAPTTAVQPSAVQRPMFGAQSGQPTTMLHTTAPTAYSPNGGSTQFTQQLPLASAAAQAVQPNVQRLSWTPVQAGQQLLGQTLPQAAGSQPQIITQPASQPLPPPSGITTTVTQPPQAALLQQVAGQR